MVTGSSLENFAEPTPALDVTQIHEDYADFVWASLQRLGVHRQDLEDQLQEVFVVVHRKLSTFDHSARLSTWLFGICLRVAAADRRRAHRRREVLTLEPAQRSNLGGSEADPERALLHREAALRLEHALSTLALERRAVFVMFEIEGIPAAAIGEMLGIPVGTVHSRLFTARTEFDQAVRRLERHDHRRGVP